MNEPSQESAPQPTAPTTFEQRLSAVQAEIAAEPTPEPAADANPPPTQEGAAAAPAVASEADKARADRAARLERLRKSEQEKVDHKTKLAEQDRLAREYQAEKARREELEQRQAALVDISKLDEASFFELAKNAKVDPAKLGDWIREGIANPERIAGHAARKALDPAIAELTSRLERSEQLMKQMAQERQQERAQAEERAATENFLGFVKESSERSPLATNFLQRSGTNEFLKIAQMAGNTLPPGAGPEALLDAIEHFLDSDGRTYAQQLAELYGLVQPTPSNGPATPPKNAAAKAKTVSNAIAQDRASVVQEEEWAKLPFEERLARLKRTA